MFSTLSCVCWLLSLFPLSFTLKQLLLFCVLVGLLFFVLVFHKNNRS
jgi:hypothetical protein